MENKVAIITGASRGIGNAIAKTLGKAGYSIAVHYNTSREKAEKTAKEIKGYGVKAIIVKGDISSISDIKKIIEKTEKHLGPISILVQNAGSAPEKRVDFLEEEYKSFTNMLRINLIGPWIFCVECAKRMLENPGKEKAIIWVTSVSSDMPSINRAGYCIAKAGASMGVKLLSARLAKENIPVWEVRPGIIETDMTAKVIKKYKKLAKEGKIPMLRIGKPDDVAEVVLSLVSGRNKYSTGSIIYVDGGLHLDIL